MSQEANWFETVELMPGTVPEAIKAKSDEIRAKTERDPNGTQ